MAEPIDSFYKRHSKLCVGGGMAFLSGGILTASYFTGGPTSATTPMPQMQAHQLHALNSLGGLHSGGVYPMPPGQGVNNGGLGVAITLGVIFIGLICVVVYDDRTKRKLNEAALAPEKMGGG